jgi:uncharacterized protein with ParB-like and HNH nuclease domain
MNNTVSIESDDLNINDLFKDFYSVPDFQREYVWEDSNVEKLLQDVYDEFYDEHNIQIQNTEYFIGSVVVCNDDEGAYQLIDGQQRLTTIYLTLCTIRDYLYDLEKTTPETLKNQIGAASMNPQTGEDVFRYRLNLQYEDSDGVLMKVAKEDEDVESIKETTESVKHILKAYQTIKEFLRINFNDDASLVKKFLAAFIHRVKLIRIITPDLTHALKVFETINDRGVGLNAMDLLKNLLFMKTNSSDYPKLKEKWKSLIDTLDRCGEKPLRYLRYYIMSQYIVEGGRPLREDEIYKWFVDNAAKIEIDKNPIGFVNHLVARSKDYANFAERKDNFSFPNNYLNNISILSGAARQHFVLLLAGHHLPQNLFNELCRAIENLFFTYIITRETTKQFERNFSKWAVELRQVKDETGLTDFINRNFIPDVKSRSNAFSFAFEELTQSRIQQYRQGIYLQN